MLPGFGAAIFGVVVDFFRGEECVGMCRGIQTVIDAIRRKVRTSVLELPRAGWDRVWCQSIHYIFIFTMWRNILPFSE
jgi:sulfite exporter TauE/SafE